MPDHPHVLAPVEDPERDERLLRLLQHHTRRFGGPGWVLADVERPIRDPGKIARNVRYIALNPCRARLVDDPLRWLFSTFRDIVGASADPWVTPSRLADALGRPRVGFARRHHAYVTGDPTVAPAARRMPVLGEVRDGTLPAVLEAARAASRRIGPLDPATAALFLAASRRLRYPVRMPVAHLGLKERTAYDWSRRPTEAAVDAVLLTLAAPRLRAPADAPRSFAAQPSWAGPTASISRNLAARPA